VSKIVREGRVKEEEDVRAFSRQCIHFLLSARFPRTSNTPLSDQNAQERGRERGEGERGDFMRVVGGRVTCDSNSDWNK
jgi:hypothetical protein